MKIVRPLLYGLVTFALAQDLVAQASSPTSTPDRALSGMNTAPGVITSIVTQGDSVVERRTIDLNEEVQVIVRFVSPPLSSVHRTEGMNTRAGMSMSAVQSQIERDHARFRSDLARLEAGASGSSSMTSILKAPGSRVSAEYRTVFNGVALHTRRWMVDQLRGLPYVRSITADVRVHALDSTSNHQIGADSVWAQYGLTGAGVKVGVLDTGIDYMHPDLGGGIGPGFKVAGGWSFVENEPNVLDAYGHGTHVAGIIAAKGPWLRGVAPDATLYVIKVLDATGGGWSSWIMSGVERAVDLDGDPGTNDHLDIINLSLGATGDPTDPLSQAVDNATLAGVLCVVSAGNDGPEPKTISSPGCAASALTVGACDSLFSPAPFSSRGPTRSLFTIKPDILAPGVGISSTFPAGDYRTASGTSMAAPHAAGAAALLRQLHPDWTPTLLKGAIMKSANDLELDLWSQGMGVLNVLKAVRTRTVATPQTLSFGMDDLTLAHWQRSDTVTIHNVADTPVTFVVDPSAVLPPGVTITTSMPSLSVPPHEVRAIAVALDVNNAIIQIPQESFGKVTGTVTLLSPGDTLRIPWSAIVSGYCDLHVAVPESSGVFGARFTPLSGGRTISADEFVYSADRTCHIRQLLPPGDYEVVVQIVDPRRYSLSWIVRDSVHVSPVASLSMSANDAPFRVGTQLKDENGEQLGSGHWMTRTSKLSSKRTGIGRFFSAGIMSTEWEYDRVSSFSSNFVFEYYYSSDFEQPKVYMYAGQVSPMLADHVTNIKAGDLAGHVIEYRLPKNVPSLKGMQAFPFSTIEWGAYFGAPSTSSLLSPFQQSWYCQPLPQDAFPLYGVFGNHQIWYDGSLIIAQGTPALLITPDQVPGPDGVLRSTLPMMDTPIHEHRGKKIIYGLGPRLFFGRLERSNSTHVRVVTNTAVPMTIHWFSPSGTDLPLFLNQAMDAEPVNVRLGLQDSVGRPIYQSTSVDQDLISPANGALNFTLPEAGRYTLRLWDPSSRVLSLNGASIADLTFDTRRPDSEPPTMTSFNIFGVDSEYTDMVLPGETGRVEFRIADAGSGLQSVSLFYHTDSNRTWVSLPLTNEGELYRASLPAFTLHDRFISLRIKATDRSGNTLDYRAEPALHIGPDYAYANRPPQAPRLLMPTPVSLLQLYDPERPMTFSWHSALDYDGWDSLSYMLHIRGGILGNSVNIWLRDTTVTKWLMSYMSPDEVYHWWVEATDGHVVVASDTTTFRTSSTVLAAPGEKSDLPKEYALAQNYPNPFNPTSTIGYDLPRESRVSLKVYNVLGQEVMDLVDAQQRAGRYTVTIDGRGLASGVYIYRIQAVSSNGTGNTEGSYIAAKKLMLLR